MTKFFVTKKKLYQNCPKLKGFKPNKLRSGCSGCASLRWNMFAVGFVCVASEQPY